MSEVSEETTYYIRTSLMFTDLTREVLFKVFKFLIKSEDITDFLSSLEQQNILRELMKKNVINKSDYNLVSGQVLNLEKLDISLLVRLILNLCKDNIPQPQRGWEYKLQPKDESLGADLLRLRVVRNKIIGHRADAKLTEAEYEKTWAKIKAILMRVVELVDSESSKNFERRINEYKRLNVDIENAKVKRLLDELLNYKIEFDHLQEKVEELSRRSKEFQEYFKITPEIFVRYIKLLFDGGRIVLCGIMMTKLGDQDLSDFLEGKKEILIRNIDEKYSRFLYSQESCSDYKTWDVYLLASILLLTFDNDLSQREIMYIERIKSAMVNYAALAFRSLDAGDFLTNWTDLIICLKDLSSNIAEDDKLQIENLIERYKNKDEGGCDAEEYFKQLRESGVEVKTLNDIYNETIEELRDMLNEMSQKDIKFEKGYVFEFKLLTICENEEINKLAEDTLEINLQASIQKSDQPSGDIRRETDKAVDIIAAHPDVTPLEIKRKCIIWSFHCSTPVGLLHILDVTQGDQFRNIFRNIAYEMHYIYGYAFIIQGKCTFESVSMVSRMINKSTSYEASREQISIPLKCSSVEGISSVLSVIKQGKTTNILNRIAEQMSADFNETVSIKLIPDLMEFRNVFEETDSDRSSSLDRNEFETEELVPVEIDRTDKHADDERKEVSARQQLYDEKMNEYAIENKGQEGNSQTITDKFQTIDHGQNRIEDVILGEKRTKSELELPTHWKESWVKRNGLIIAWILLAFGVHYLFFGNVDDEKIQLDRIRDIEGRLVDFDMTISTLKQQQRNDKGISYDMVEEFKNEMKKKVNELTNKVDSAVSDVSSAKPEEAKETLEDKYKEIEETFQRKIMNLESTFNDTISAIDKSVKKFEQTFSKREDSLETFERKFDGITNMEERLADFDMAMSTLKKQHMNDKGIFHDMVEKFKNEMTKKDETKLKELTKKVNSAASDVSSAKEILNVLEEARDTLVDKYKEIEETIMNLESTLNNKISAILKFNEEFGQTFSKCEQTFSNYEASLQTFEIKTERKMHEMTETFEKKSKILSAVKEDVDTIKQNTFNKESLIMVCIGVVLFEFILAFWIYLVQCRRSTYSDSSNGSKDMTARDVLERIPHRVALSDFVCIVSFDEARQTEHDTLVKSALGTMRDIQMKYFVVRKHEHLQKLPKCKFYIMCTEFSKRHVIIEEPGLGLGDLKWCTYEVIQRYRANMVILYTRDPGSRSLGDKLYNPNIYCVAKQPELIGLRDKGRFISTYDTLTEVQKGVLHDDIAKCMK